MTTDEDGDSLTYSIVSEPSNGVLTGTAPDVTYTPNADYNGPDSFTFKVNDGKVNSNTATVSITVNPAAPAEEEFTFTGTVPKQGESRHTVSISEPGAASMYVKLTWSGWGDLRLRIYSPVGEMVAEVDNSSWRNKVEETTIYDLEAGEWQVAAYSESRWSSINYTIEGVINY